MTSRTDYTIPYDREKIRSGEPEELDKALYEIVKSIEDTQKKNAENISGNIRADYSENSSKWTPILKDGTTSTTFTYVHQRGFILRKGIMVDSWFDISWNGASDPLTSYMNIEMPYNATRANGKPFVGVVQTSTFAYTGGTGCVINVQQNSLEGQIWNVGSGFPTAIQNSVITGQIIGYVRYVGQQNK